MQVDGRRRGGACVRDVFVVLLLALATTLPACVNREKRDVEAAREALETCEAEFGPGHERCEEARLRLLDAQARYDQQARRAWSCDPTQDLCPTPR